MLDENEQRLACLRLRYYMRAKLSKKPRKNRPFVLALLHRSLVFVLLFHLTFFAIVALQCLIYKTTLPALTNLMVQRSIEYSLDTLFGKKESPAPKVQPLVPLPFKELGPRTRRAFILLEDQHFYEHSGISLGAIREAYERNKKLGQLVYGGSTISQQLAKNLFLYSQRSFFRKYLELGTTLIMEGILGKDRILEIYLNTIEFGPGVFGLGQASYYHYGKPYAALSIDQIYRMAAIINNPLGYKPRTLGQKTRINARYQALLNY